MSQTEIANTIVLGTVQFGMPYGLNKTIPGVETVFGTLDRVWEIGVRQFDTARAYGEAEFRIGRWIAERRDRVPKIFTKFSRHDSLDPLASVQLSLNTSRELLGVERFDGVLAHDSSLLHDNNVADYLRDARNSGDIGQFGASVYTDKEARRALDVNGCSLIQAPASPFDTRIVDRELLQYCDRKSATLMIRSVYLQGIVGCRSDALPAHLHAIAPTLDIFSDAARAVDLDNFAFALSYCRHVLGLRRFVLGMNEPGHVDSILAGIEAPPPPPELVKQISESVAALPAACIDPRQWPKS